MHRSWLHRTPRSAAVLAATLILAIPATAQHPGEPAAREQAASELIDILRLEEMHASSMDFMMESMIAQNPSFGPARDVFADFFEEFLPWDELRSEYVRLYAGAFSERELRELIAFYETPVGQKTLDMMPDLMQQGVAIGQKKIEPHLPELQRRIMERLGGTPDR